MKWKFYQVNNLLNIVTICAFLFFIIYNLATRNSQPEPDMLLIVFAAAAVCLTKDFLAIGYQRRIESGDLYISSTRWLFILLAILQLACAAFLSYGLYQMAKDIGEVRDDWTYYFGLADFFVFIVTAFYTLLSDRSLLKRLRMLEDLSLGILADHKEDDNALR